MRRVRVTHMPAAGDIAWLDEAVAHHLLHVLRAAQGDAVEVFDGRGSSATGTVVLAEADSGSARANQSVGVRIDRQASPSQLAAPDPASTRQVVVCSAVPKGDRADWLVEKLAEVGAKRWIPLRTARSVVHPEGGGGGGGGGKEGGKKARWQRIAQEAGRQSGRTFDLEISDLTDLKHLLSHVQSGLNTGSVKAALIMSLSAGATPVVQVMHELGARGHSGGDVWLLVGPEGGWTPEEEQLMRSAGCTPAHLGTGTVLRVETAAVVAAAMVGQGQVKSS